MNIKTYKIDTSLGGKCFNYIVNKYKNDILIVINKIKPLYEKYINYLTFGLDVYKSTGGIIMYEDEIAEISGLLGISFVECLLMQLTYEFCSACTSSIKYQYDLAEYILIRTMDWNLPELKKITVRLSFFDKDKYLFDAVGWVGCVGVFTGLKKNEYSVAMNYRRSEKPNFMDNMMGLWKGHFPCSFYLRNLLSFPSESLSGSLKNLEEVYFVAPCYLTILSSDKRYILIRGRSTHSLKDNSKDFLIQTNIDDVTSPECVNILYSKERHSHMLKMFVGEKIYDLKDVISHIKKYPVTNEETIYKTIISLKDFLYIDI